jgi:hypothetical protein
LSDRPQAESRIIGGKALVNVVGEDLEHLLHSEYVKKRVDFSGASPVIPFQ